jgi:uncharacterized membrane protein YjjP (DUF1212 family)
VVQEHSKWLTLIQNTDNRNGLIQLRPQNYRRWRVVFCLGATAIILDTASLTIIPNPINVVFEFLASAIMILVAVLLFRVARRNLTAKRNP